MLYVALLYVPKVTLCSPHLLMKIMSSFVATTQDRLDPIDWATYEPYLWANAKRYYARTATLYGMLVQLHRMHTDGAAAGGRAAGAGTAGAATTPTGVVDLNPINVLPVAPRFQYLPISAPTGAALGASRNRPSTQSFPRLASGAGQLQKYRCIVRGSVCGALYCQVGHVFCAVRFAGDQLAPVIRWGWVGGALVQRRAASGALLLRNHHALSPQHAQQHTLGKDTAKPKWRHVLIITCRRMPLTMHVACLAIAPNWH